MTDENQEYAAYNKGYSGRRLKDIGLVGMGAALGGGLGWFAGDSLAKVVGQHPNLAGPLRYAVPVVSAAAGGYAGMLEARRREVEQERAHMAGLLAQQKLREGRAKPVQGGPEKTAAVGDSVKVPTLNAGLQIGPDGGLRMTALGAGKRWFSAGRTNSKGKYLGSQAPVVTASNPFKPSKPLTTVKVRGRKDDYMPVLKHLRERSLSRAEAERAMSADKAVWRHPTGADLPKRYRMGKMEALFASMKDRLSGKSEVTKLFGQSYNNPWVNPLLAGVELSEREADLKRLKGVSRVPSRLAGRTLLGQALADLVPGAAYSAGLLAAAYGTKKLLDRSKEKDQGPEKTARVIAHPGEWSHTEKRTLTGGALGALAGLAVGGATAANPTLGRFALPGAAIGSLLGYRKAKKEMTGG